MSNKIKSITVIALMLILTMAFSLSMPTVRAQGLTQLCMVVDSSGSIGSGNWNIIRQGIANAIRYNLTHDGSIELSIVKYSDNAVVELTPTVITAANFETVATAIESMAYIGGSTATPAGIFLGWKTISDSPNFQTAEKQIINLATDGVPNVRNNNATVDLDGDTNIDSYDDCIAAKNIAVSGGLDELDMEGIGISDILRDWFKDWILIPQPGTVAPPYTPGWIEVVADAEAFTDAIAQKFVRVIETTTPPPSVGGELVTTSVLTLYASFAGIAAILASTAIVAYKIRRKT